MKEGWEYKKLGEVCEIYQPQTIASNLLKKDGKYPVFGANGMIGRYDSYNHEEPEVLLCCRGATCGAINVSFPFSWINGNAMVVKPINDSYLKAFLRYLLLTLDYSHIITGAAQPQITRKSLSPVTVPVPSLSEQQRIVDYLDSAFAKIDAMKANAEKSLNEAKALFQASLKEMLEPKEGWEEKYLKDIAEYSIGLTYKPTDVCKDGTIVLRSSNIQGGKLDLNDIVRVNANIKDNLYVQCGDILMCSRNGSARLVGKVCIIPELKERMTYGTFMMVIRSVYNPLLYHYFDTGLFRSQIKHGEANMINQITRYMLDEVKLNLPPVAEQQRIVATLDSLKSKVDRLQANFEKISQECDALKQAILRQVFE